MRGDEILHVLTRNCNFLISTFFLFFGDLKCTLLAEKQ